MKRAFGTPDPLQDARRVRTAQLITDAVSNSNLPAAFALENKIYLWPADGGAISTFEATAVGLGEALAAATAGDTIWLPSIPIAISANITLGTYTALVGISEYAMLIFSGFSDTALTMAAGAVCHGFSLVFQSNGTTAIGIDARFSGAVIDNVSVYAFGGSSSNIAVYAGAAET